jgi:glycosyltransferase involved in cell wall biosynthesis
VDVSVLIGTYNRCGLLAATLDSVAAMQVPGELRWETIVVDNNSTDGTRAVVESRRETFPVPLRYLFERRQGKSHALNAGIAASGAPVIAATDDDVLVDPGWLDAGARPLLTRRDIHYTGGPVLPLWEAPPPAWFQEDSAVLKGPLALLDYGPETFVFEERRLIPLGVNMALCRSVVDRVGGFHTAMDRRGTSLLGQGQAEFFFRTRAAGLRGLYVPSMRVRHHVPKSRMNAAYCRRWWYWKGVARARMEDWHPVSELGLDLASVPRLLRVPRFMWRTAAEDLARWLHGVLGRDTIRRIKGEAMLAYFAGYFVGRRSAAQGRHGVVPGRTPEHRNGTGSAEIARPVQSQAREL